MILINECGKIVFLLLSLIVSLDQIPKIFIHFHFSKYIRFNMRAAYSTWLLKNFASCIRIKFPLKVFNLLSFFTALVALYCLITAPVLLCTYS